MHGDVCVCDCVWIIIFHHITWNYSDQKGWNWTSCIVKMSLTSLALCVIVMCWFRQLSMEFSTITNKVSMIKIVPSSFFIVHIFWKYLTEHGKRIVLDIWSTSLVLEIDGLCCDTDKSCVNKIAVYVHLTPWVDSTVLIPYSAIKPQLQQEAAQTYVSKHCSEQAQIFLW